jgi:hypothetical protein
MPRAEGNHIASMGDDSSQRDAAAPVGAAPACMALAIFYLAPSLIIVLELLNPALSIPVVLLALLWIYEFGRFLVPAGSAWRGARPSLEGGGRWPMLRFHGLAESIAVLALACIWIYGSGIGGFTFCRWDYVKHSVIFSNLLQHRLPIALPADGGAPAFLHYYFAYYITPVRLYQGLKTVFAGLDFNKLLFLVYVAALYGALRVLAASLRVPALLLLALFIIYGGLDFLGVMAFGARLFPVARMPLLHIPLYTGLEWWGIPYAPQSLTSNLYWAPQHFFAALIGTALISAIFIAERAIPAKLLHGAAVVALCTMWSPYAAVGFGMLYAGASAAAILTQRPADATRPPSPWLRMLPASAFPLAILIFTVIFYSAAEAASPPGVVLTTSSIAGWLLTFLLKHAIALSALIIPCFARYRPRPAVGGVDLAYVFAFGLAADALLLCFTHGTYNDWAMRTTLPQSILLAGATCRLLVMEGHPALRRLIVIVLLLSASAPLMEIAQSAVLRSGCGPYDAFSLRDLGPLAVQYEARPDSLLYKYLGRSP